MKTAIEIIRETLGVDSEGNISFRTRQGRGSGSGVKIPANEIQELVRILNETQNKTNIPSNNQ